MLALLAVAAAVAPSSLVPFTCAGDVVFDSGVFQIVGPADIAPGDDVFVAANALGHRTIIRVIGNTSMASLTMRAGGETQLSVDAVVTGDVLVQNDGEFITAVRARVEGELLIQSGGVGLIGPGTQGADVRVEAGAEFRMSGALTGDFVMDGDGSCFGSVAGATQFGEQAEVTATLASFNGPVHVDGAARLRSFGSHYTRGVELHGSAVFDVQRSGTYGDVIQVRESSTMSVKARFVTVPFGEVAGSSGFVIGEDLSGEPFSFGFLKDTTATLEIVNLFGTLGFNHCIQNEPNSLGVEARITSTGTHVALENDLTLTATGLPLNSFGFFIVGTESAHTVLAENVICIGGNIGRYVAPGQIRDSGLTGTISIQAELSPAPGNPGTFVQPGDTLYFQAWYRDSAASGTPFRFSHGHQIRFI